VTQRPSDPGIQRPGDPDDPVTVFYSELQMSTYVADKRLQWARGLPVSIAVWRLHASGKSNFEDHLLNVSISMTVGRIFTKNIYLYVLILRSGKSGPKDQVALHYYYTSPSHWCTTHEVSKL